jgi:D-alanyl-D-alanine carboxypeptidase
LIGGIRQSILLNIVTQQNLIENTILGVMRSSNALKFTFILLFTLHNVCANSQSINNLCDSIQVKYNIPELAFAVLNTDTTFIKHVSGYHKVNSKDDADKANIDDYFHLGSNTKAVTGFIAAYLVEHGKIRWDSRLFDIFPGWKKTANPAYYDVTLQNLLSHRARIQPYTSGLEYAELPQFTGTTSQQRMLFAQYLLHEKPVKAGAAFDYSNAGYSIAACMVEKASGKTWEHLVALVLHDEAGINYKLGWPNLTDAKQPWGHQMEAGKLMPVPGTTEYNLHLAEPAGDISMSLADYIKFITLNLRGLEGQDNVLKASTYNFLHYSTPDYAIGWGNAMLNKQQLSEHLGSAGTFVCYVLINKTANKAYIVMANNGSNAAQPGIFALVNQLRKIYP